MPNEEWKQIEEFPTYEVSSLGNVRRGAKRLKGCPKRGGYLHVGLYKDGGQYQRLIHRLVATAFIPNPENKATIDHIDWNCANNAVGNLRWYSVSEQRIHTRPYSKSGHKNIHERKDGLWQVSITRNNIRVFSTCYKTLEAAIEAKDNFLNSGT
jgi:hypothetical protein